MPTHPRQAQVTFFVLIRCRKAARVLLTLSEKDPRRLFEGK